MESRYNFTGAEQSFTVTTPGYYRIEANGAAGSGGNIYGTTYTSAGGNGARLAGSYPLELGDVVHVIVGGRGSCVQATAKDGTSGGGGGYTMVTREIPSVKDSRYQFVKSGQAFEVLLMAAGGGGSQDCAYRGYSDTGENGRAAAYWHPNNYTSPPTTTCTATASAGSILSVQQYISQNAVGGYYARNNGKAQGGYGGGGAIDDARSYGGGWAAVPNMSYVSGSWSIHAQAVGTDGANSGDGYCLFSYDHALKGTLYYGVSSTPKQIKKFYFGINGQARRIKKAYYGVGGLARCVYSKDDP